MDRKKILEEAEKCVCSDRNNQYGEPEDSFKVIARYWDVYIKNKKTPDIDAHDVAIMEVLFKIARIQTGGVKADNYIDGVGYMACAAQIATSESEW